MLAEFDKDPDFINEDDVKWWADISSTHFAQKEDSFGTTLNVVVWLVETPDGNRTRVIVDEEQQILYESQGLESIGVYIDKLKMNKRFGPIE